MPLMRRFRGLRSAKREFILMASIAFITSGMLSDLPELQSSAPISEGDGSVPGGNQTRRYCDPPNMTALAAYYESSEEASYDYDFLQNQGAMIQSNISTTDVESLRRAVVSDLGAVLSFFPACYLSSRYGPSKVFATSTLPFYCLLYVFSEMSRVLEALVLGCLQGVAFFSFYEMIFQFMLDSRDIITSFAGVKYVGVSIGEMIKAYQIFGQERRYKFYVAIFISAVWFFLWSKMKFWSPRNNINYAERRRKHLKMRIPWQDVLISRPVWMTMIAIFAASCANACIFSVTRMYLKNVYYLQVEKQSAISESLHFVFSISCGFSAYYLIKGKIVSVTSARRMVVYVSHFIPAGFLFVLGFVGCGAVTPLVLYCMAIVATGAEYTGAYSSPLDLAPTYSEPILALCFTFGSLGSLLMHYLTYYILLHQELMSWRFIFSLNSLILLVTAIFFMLRGSGSAQPWNYPENTVTKESKNVTEGQVSVAVPSPKQRTKSIYMVEKKILKVLHVQEPDKFTRVRAYSTSLPNERSSANRPNIYRPSNKKRASIS